MKDKRKIIGKTLFKIIHLWTPPIIWGIFIFSFSSVTTPRVSEVHWQDFFLKKLAHLIEYGVFAVLIFRAVKGSGVTSKKALIFALFFSVFYGITDEFHQSFTPGREPTVRDALIDTAGSLTALLIVRDYLSRISGKLSDFMVKLGIKY